MEIKILFYIIILQKINCNIFLHKNEYFVVLFKNIYNICAFCCIFCLKITSFPAFSIPLLCVNLNIFPFFRSYSRKKQLFPHSRQALAIATVLDSSSALFVDFFKCKLFINVYERAKNETNGHFGAKKESFFGSLCVAISFFCVNPARSNRTAWSGIHSSLTSCSKGDWRARASERGGAFPGCRPENSFRER